VSKARTIGGGQRRKGLWALSFFSEKNARASPAQPKRPVGRSVALVNSKQTIHTKPFAEAIGLVCVADAVDRLVRFGLL
jgi:hypothetical protein